MAEKKYLDYRAYKRGVSERVGDRSGIVDKIRSDFQMSINAGMSRDAAIEQARDQWHQEIQRVSMPIVDEEEEFRRTIRLPVVNDPYLLEREQRTTKTAEKLLQMRVMVEMLQHNKQGEQKRKFIGTLSSCREGKLVLADVTYPSADPILTLEAGMVAGLRAVDTAEESALTERPEQAPRTVIKILGVDADTMHIVYDYADPRLERLVSELAAEIQTAQDINAPVQGTTIRIADVTNPVFEQIITDRYLKLPDLFEPITVQPS